MKNLFQDVAYAVRIFARSPAVFVAIILLIAFCIAANTAVFSTVNAILIRPLRFRAADRLVWISETKIENNLVELALAPQTFLDWQRQQRSFDSIAAFTDEEVVFNMGEPEIVRASAVTSSFFSTLGAYPMFGRDFREEDGRNLDGPVVVLGYEFWRSRFGADPSVPGKPINIDGQMHTIIGVMGDRTEFPSGSQLWIPLLPRIGKSVTMRDAHYLSAIGRLRDSVDLSTAEAELNVLQQRIARQDASYRNFGARVVPLHEHIVGSVRRPLTILLTAVLFVLLVCCFNVANLMLVRASVRRREICCRLALGASGRRIVRQLLTESVIMAIIAGAVGVVLANGLLAFMLLLSPSELPRVSEVKIDIQALGFTLLVSVFTGILFGAMPSFYALRLNVADALRDGTAQGGAATGLRLRNFLVAAELIFTVVLLVGAGLMLRSFIGLLHTNPGFRAENVSTFSLALSTARYPAAQKQALFYANLLTTIQTIPGIRSAALVSNLPMSGQSKVSPVLIDEQQKPQAGQIVQQVAITPDYFRTLGIELLQGRSFTIADIEDAPPVAIVNQAFVSKYLHGRHPFARTVRTFFGKQVPRRIVGVVQDVRHTGLMKPAMPTLYIPYWQDPSPAMTVVTASDLAFDTVTSAVRAAVRQADPEQPIMQAVSLQSLLSKSMAQPRFYTYLLTTFGIIALCLASVGLYTLISYTVSNKTRDIGIRMALGASPGDVARQILRDALLLVGSCLMAGLGMASVLTRILTGMLYEVRPFDWPTYLGIGGLITVLSLIAIYVPVRRAINIDPMNALRFQ